MTCLKQRDLSVSLSLEQKPRMRLWLMPPLKFNGYVGCFMSLASHCKVARLMFYDNQ